jgi:hypothetical protein
MAVKHRLATPQALLTCHVTVPDWRTESSNSGGDGISTFGVERRGFGNDGRCYQEVKVS